MTGYVYSKLVSANLPGNPSLDVETHKPPHPADLERRNLLGLRQPVDRPFFNLEIARDFLDGEDVPRQSILTL